MTGQRLSNKPYPLNTFVFVDVTDPITKRKTVCSGFVDLVGEDYSDVSLDPDGVVITRKNIDIYAVFTDDKRIGEK